MPTPPLPDTVRLPPHRSVLSLGPTGRVIGLDPDTALAIDDLPPPLAEMLDELHVPARSHVLVARAEDRGVDAGVTTTLLRDLLAEGALVDAAVVGRRDGHRAGSTVVVSGRGPLTVGIVTGLVLAGVGTVHTETDGVVRSGDVGTGLLDADRGTERLTAIRAALRRLDPGAATTAPPMRLVPDLVVLADDGPQPARLASLLAGGVAHLPARLRDGIGVVGPLVLPGRSTCLGCLELHRVAQDPAWPSVSARLVGRAGSADPSSLVATAALATAQAIAALDGAGGDGTAPATLDATLELDITVGTLARRAWTPHPECHCRAAPNPGGRPHGRATSAMEAEGETIGT